MSDTVLILANSETDLGDTETLLGRRGFAVDRCTDARGARDALMEAGAPALVLLEAEMPGAPQLAEIAHTQLPDTAVVVLCPPDALARVAEDFKQAAAEFLTLPPETLALRLVLRRLRRTGRMVQRLRQLECDLEGLVQKRAGRLLEKARFGAVRQIVDKMATFIAQIAAEAQGGIRYFNELPYFVSIHNAKGALLSANAAYQRHFGDPLPRYSWEIYSGKRANPYSSPVGRTIRSGDVVTTHAVVRYRSGLKVPVIVYTAPIHDEDDNLALILEVFAGSQEIERMAREARTTQQRYQQLFDAVPCHVAVLDRRFRITAINRCFKDDFGDPVGAHFFDVLRPAKFPPYRGPITQSLRDGQPHQGEVVMTDGRGRQLNMMAWTAPITTGTGKLIQVLVIFADITAQRQIQDDLSSLGLMISTLAHNLRGSLTGLDAGLYLIENGFYRNLAGKIEEGLDVSKMMAERLRSMVTDILFSAKDRPLQLARVDVLQFAGDLAANIERRMRGADIAFRCHFAPDLGAIEADANILRPALNNILENALEACIEDPAEKYFEIDFTASGDPNHITLEIADTGPGMTAEQRDRLFSLFYSSKGPRGTGLGMFITRKVIQRHGGEIHVDSAPGQGTRFRIRLPRRPGA